MARAFFTTGGTLYSDSPGYVRRSADKQLFDSLVTGEFCYVLDSRQKGKSSLVSRALSRLEEAGLATATIDLQRFGTNLDAERWYAGLLNAVAESLVRSANLDLTGPMFESWGSHQQFGPLERWMRILQKVVLPALGLQKLVIFVDEIDFVRSLPFSTDEFFAGIREWYNRRSEDPDLSRLTFCLLGVATPSDLIRDVRITPFNVGRRIDLTDFTLAEAMTLTTGFVEAGRTPRQSEVLIRQIHSWTNGHPYLTQKLCAAVAADSKLTTSGEVDRLVEQTFFAQKSLEEEPNLRDISRRVLETPLEGLTPEESRARILDLFRQVRENRKVRDDDTDPVASVLKLAGLTTVLGGYLLVRNKVYFRVFDHAWIQAGMPDAELVRQRTAVRRATRRTALIAGAVVVSIGSLAAYSWNLARSNGKLVQQTRTALSGTQSALHFAESQQEQAQAADRQLQHELLVVTNAVKAEQRAKEYAVQQSKVAIEQSHRAGLAGVDARRQTARAIRNERAAKQENEKSKRLLYDLNMHLLQTAFAAGDSELVTKLLNKTAQSPFKNLEWFYWNQLMHAHLADLTSDYENNREVCWSSDGSRVACAGRSFDTTSGKVIQDLDPANLPLKWPHSPADQAATILATATVQTRTRVAILASLSSQSVQVFELPNKRPIASLNVEGLDINLRRREFSPDGRRLVGWNAPKGQAAAYVWDAESGKLLHRLSGTFGEYLSALFSSDGSRVLLQSRKASTVWDAHTGELLATLKPKRRFNIDSAVFSPDGALVATGEHDGAEVWDAITGKSEAKLSTEGFEASCLSFSADGKRVVAGTESGRIFVWDLRTEHWVNVFDAHKGNVTDVSFSRDGGRILSLGDDQFARIFDAASGANLLTVHCDGWGTCTFSPDGSRFTAGGKLWDAASIRASALPSVVLGARSFSMPKINDIVAGAGILVAGKQVVLARPMSTSFVIDMATGQLRRTLEPDGGTNSNHLFDDEVEFSKDGSRMMMVSPAPNGYVGLWNTLTGKVIMRSADRDGFVSRACMSRDGNRVAVVYKARAKPEANDDVVKVWSDSGYQISTTRTAGQFAGVALSPDGNELLTCVNSRKGLAVTLKDAANGRILSHRTLKYVSWPNDGWFSPDGAEIAVASADSVVLLNASSLSDHIPLLTLVNKSQFAQMTTIVDAGFTSHFNHPVFAADGSRLLCGSNVINVKTGKVVPLSNVDLTYNSAQFSSDGERLFTSDRMYNSTQVWDTETGSPVLALPYSTMVLYQPHHSPGILAGQRGVGDTETIYLDPNLAPPVRSGMNWLITEARRDEKRAPAAAAAIASDLIAKSPGSIDIRLVRLNCTLGAYVQGYPSKADPGLWEQWLRDDLRVLSDARNLSTSILEVEQLAKDIGEALKPDSNVPKPLQPALTSLLKRLTAKTPTLETVAQKVSFVKLAPKPGGRG